MPNKISKIEQNYTALDFKELEVDLELVEGMDEHEFAVAKYKATGERPVKIAKVDATKFGLRHAFWDVYAPVDSSQGQWVLEADTDGNEIITRKES